MPLDTPGGTRNSAAAIRRSGPRGRVHAVWGPSASGFSRRRDRPSPSLAKLHSRRVTQGYVGLDGMPPTVDRDRRRSTSLPRRRLGPSSTGGRRESARSSAVASASSPHGPPQRSRTRSPYEPVSGQTVRRRPSVPPTTEAEDVERNPTVPSAPSCDQPASSYRPRIPRASLDARKKEKAQTCEREPGRR
jgi:hypothetical protein